MFGKTKTYILALYGFAFKIIHNKKYNILTIDETIDKMHNGNSIVRFGDGEFMLLDGGDIENFQKTDVFLRQKLGAVLNSDESGLLVCLPDTLNSVKECKFSSKVIWLSKIGKNHTQYSKYCRFNRIYGNAMVSRPYMAYKNKAIRGGYFKKILELFKDKDIVLIEGIYSRSGVGNDMFKYTKSLKRILCPNKDAFSKYDEILSETLKTPKDKLILVALGPAGKVLTYDLFKQGYTVWDIGHLDSEYEWFLRKAENKSVITGKHTAEFNDEDEIVSKCTDKAYNNSVIAQII